jgi:signal transduction histidine kinase
MTAPATFLIRVAQRLQLWARERPFVIDMAIAALAAILSFSDLYSIENLPARDQDLLAVLLILGASVALIWRRVAPFTVLAVVLSAMAIMYVRDYDTYLSSLGLPALYTVAAIGEPRRRAWAFVTAGAVALFALACVTNLQTSDGFSIATAVGMIGFLVASVLAGAIVRNRHEIFLDTEARADRAEADQLVAAERAVANERLRIAREMHDVVAHGMSVISVQAAAAKETFQTRPDRALELLDSIETTGRESLAEMRRMLGVLRSGEDGDSERIGPELTPQPSLGDLDRLVSGCVKAGTPTELQISGDPVRLPPGIELAAFRIVQEALTNVLKHGGPNASARVELAYESTQIRVSVLDTGRGVIVKPKPAGSGNGLIGMRERVDAYDGEVSAGPRAGGGYAVIATLPLATDPDRRRVESSDETRERTS